MELTKAKNIYKSICEVTTKAIYTDIYLVCVSFFVYFMWLFNLSAVGIVAMCALVSLTLLFTDDLSTLFLPIFSVLLVVRNISENEILALWPALIPVVLSGVYFCLRNRPQKFKLGKMFFPQVAVSAALLLGGLGTISSANYLRALPLVLVLGVGVLAIYFLFLNYTQKTHTDIPVYFAKCCVCMGIIVGAQLATVAFSLSDIHSDWVSTAWNLGWGNRNMIATFFLFAIAMSFYLCTRDYKYGFIYLIVGSVLAFCLLVTISRGGVLFGAIMFVVAFVLSTIKGNSKSHLICAAVIVGIGLILCIIFDNKIVGLLSDVWKRFSQITMEWEDGDIIFGGTSGRAEEDGLYDQAIIQFFKHPLLGCGIGHTVVVNSTSISRMDWFHSTVFEVMGSLGIVGMLAYAFYYSVRFGTIFRNGNIKNKFPLFVFISWIGFEGQALLDVGVMEPVFMIIVTLEMVVVENFRGKAYEDFTSVFVALPARDNVGGGMSFVATGLTFENNLVKTDFHNRF